MTIRLHVTRLKADTPTPPEVLGSSTTINISGKLPNLQEAHSLFVAYHEHAPLLISILTAGATLFPTGPRPSEMTDGPPPKAA